MPTPPPAPIFDTLIVPGQRIGPIAVGMPGTQLLAALGSPVESMHLPWSETQVRFSNGLLATVRDSDNRVPYAVVNDARYATKEGTRVGLTEFEVRTRQGLPRSVSGGEPRVLCYHGLMVWFEGKSGRAAAIAVDGGRGRHGC